MPKKRNNNELAQVEKIEKELKQFKSKLNRSEIALKVSEEKYKNLLERSSDIIYVHQDGKIVLASNACTFLFGAKNSEEVIGKDVIEDIVHPDYREVVKKRIKKILKKGEEVGFLEEKIIKFNGEIINIDVCAVPFSYNGKPAIKVYARDITKIKKAEDELRKSHENLQNLSTYLQTIQEKERLRISREIHDELGQLLTVLKIEVQNLKKKNQNNKKDLMDDLDNILSLIDIIIHRVKTISYQLRPPLLDHFGLYPAIEWQIKEFEESTGIHCKVKLNPENITLDSELSISIFRVLQEALTNIARHSKATKVEVSINKIDSKLTMKIVDNGIGIPEEKISDTKSLGIINIKERISHFQGFVKISGQEGKGTTVFVKIPLTKKGELYDQSNNSR